MRTSSFPYRTASPETWKLEDWRRVEGGTRLELQPRLNDWDYSINLALVCEVVVDAGRLRAETGLSRDDELSLVGLWHASSTGIREVGGRHRLPGGGEERFELSVELDGSKLGGWLTLERQIVLTSARPGADPTTATKPGSILLSEPAESRTSVLLEGDAARFPTEVIDFGQLSIAEPGSLWFLEMDTTDLDQAALGNLRLYVNGGHPAIRAALNEQSWIGELIRSVLQWDVARLMVQRALDCDELGGRWGEFEEWSLGATLQGLIQRFWPGENADSLKVRRAANPARFEYQLQARMSLLAKV